MTITAHLLDQLAAQTRQAASALTAAKARIEAAERILALLANGGLRANYQASYRMGTVSLHLHAFSTEDGLREALALDPSVAVRRHDVGTAAGEWFDILYGGQSISLSLAWLPAEVAA